jgi:hypothetical protein
MTTQHIRNGYLLSQEHEEGMVEHSIVVQQYEGGISIKQTNNDIYVDDSHVGELIKILRQLQKETSKA